MISSVPGTTLPAPAAVPFAESWTLADLQAYLGGVPLERIRLYPQPGTATEDDALRMSERENRLFELVDGVLVEKPVGWYESLLAGIILQHINNFLEQHDLGKALGADGLVRILPGRLRMADVCFISWSRLGKQKRPRRPVPSLVPDLAVEVLSESNTAAEIDRKLDEYFAAGVRLAWVIDPQAQHARVYSARDAFVEIDRDGELDGGDVLPGFRLPLADLFDRADREGPDEIA